MPLALPINKLTSLHLFPLVTAYLSTLICPIMSRAIHLDKYLQADIVQQIST